MIARFSEARGLSCLVVLIWVQTVTSSVAFGEQEKASLEHYTKLRDTMTSVARLFNQSLSSRGLMLVDWQIRDLNGAIDEIQRLESKPSLTDEEKERLEDRYQACSKAVSRFSETTQQIPGIIRVATQETASSVASFAQGRNLAVLILPGKEGSLPSLERILVHEESPAELVSNATGDGHHFCFLEFADLPLGEHSYHLSFKGREAPDHTIAVSILKPSRLEVRIVEGSASNPVPCMISLVSLSDHTYRIPMEAVDYDGHFDDGPRIRKIIAVGAPFWKELTACCVDGVASFDVFPGRWRLTVAKGIEYIPSIEEFDLDSVENTTKTVTLRRWTDSSSLGWYSGDGHVHTFQQTDEQRKRIVTWAKAMDIHVINTMKMGDINRTYFENEGFGRAFRFQDGETVLVPGQECPRTGELGHTQAINLATHMVRDTTQYYLYDFMFDGAHAQGALTGYCHVGWMGFHVDRDMSLNVPRGKVDFFEVLQFAKINPELWYDFLNLGYKVTAFAGSDMPWGGSVGEVRVYARLGKSGFDPDRWYEAVRKGRTFVSNGPMLSLKVNEALPGDEIDLAQPSTLRVYAGASGHPIIGLPKKLEIVINGDVVRTATTAESIATPLALQFDLPVVDGLWIAARTVCDNGAIAHTTPVYVDVAGKGFAKTKDLDNLLAKRRKSLTEIEDLVATERVKNPTGAISLLGDRLTERVEIAREIYDKLETGKEEGTQ